MSDWRCDRIGSAMRGLNPTVLAHLPEGFAVMGDVQWLPGYSLLLTDDPTVQRLSDLPRGRRLGVLGEHVPTRRGRVEQACAAVDPGFRRVNLEILGNADPFLHSHIWPRCDWEPPELLARPVWLYPPTRWHDPSTALGLEHEVLRAAIKSHLTG